jgi:hypothetical protein
MNPCSRERQKKAVSGGGKRERAILLRRFHGLSLHLIRSALLPLCSQNELVAYKIFTIILIAS